MPTASRFPGSHFLRNLIQGRSLIYQLVRRDFQQRYVGSIAGWLWGLIHPLVLIGIYTLVFVYALRTPVPKGAVTDNYPLFLFAGMLPWLLFSETVQRSTPALVDYSNLIKKTVFPAEIVPLTVFLSTLLSHLLAMALMIVAVAVWLNKFSFAVLALPLVVLLLGMLSLGLAWIAAGLHVYLRDTAQVVAVVLMAWFWMTPIFLFEDYFRGKLRVVLEINPLTYAVRAYRDTLLGSRLPHASDLLILAAFAVAAFLVGGLFFRYTKRGFADVL
jgi:homopolymeric O-antigen transport system permease protein